jgi:Predicted endonuclease containing a URI domain
MNSDRNSDSPRGNDGDWFVYVLRCGDGSLYTGATNNLERRLAQHQSGRGAAYTRAHLPVELCHWECAGTKGDALRREAAIKKLTRREKLRLIAQSAPTPGQLSETNGSSHQE